jgi:hypothetical protein
MIGDLYFSTSGVSRPAYVLDCLGNLVRCSADGAPDTLIPFSIEVVSTESELRHPHPWSITLEQVESRMSFVAEALPEILSVYPHGKLLQADYPFMMPVPLIEEETIVEEAIRLFPDLPPDVASSLREKLAENGVFEIPYIKVFNPNIHEATGDGIFVSPITYVSTGWCSSMKVYRKVLIRSA